jgi:AraC-like DNA-binding protein
MQEQILPFVIFAIALQAFVFALVFIRQKKGHPEKMLAYYELVYCITYALLCLYFLNIYRWFIVSYVIIVPFFSLFPVLFYFFIRRLVKKQLQYKDWVHLILPVFLLLSNALVMPFLSYEELYDTLIEQEKIIEAGVFQQVFVLQNKVLFPIVLTLQPFVYIVFCWREVYAFRKKLKENYATLDGLDLQWAIRFILLFSVLFIVSVIWQNNLFLYLTVFVVNVYIAVETLDSRRVRSEIHQQQDHSNNNKNRNDENKYQGSSLCDEEKKNIYDQLISYMEREKKYLNPGFSLSDIAMDIGVNRQYISQVINEVGQKNFYLFVNEYRIQEFIDRFVVEYTNNMSIEGMASNIGFLSKSSFYTAFKEIKGCTPSKFIKESKLKNSLNR